MARDGASAEAQGGAGKREGGQVGRQVGSRKKG